MDLTAFPDAPLIGGLFASTASASSAFSATASITLCVATATATATTVAAPLLQSMGASAIHFVGSALMPVIERVITSVVLEPTCHTGATFVTASIKSGFTWELRLLEMVGRRKSKKKAFLLEKLLEVTDGLLHPPTLGRPLGAAACCSCVLLMRALPMTSSHSKVAPAGSKLGDEKNVRALTRLLSKTCTTMGGSVASSASKIVGGWAVGVAANKLGLSLGKMMAKKIVAALLAAVQPLLESLAERAVDAADEVLGHHAGVEECHDLKTILLHVWTNWEGTMWENVLVRVGPAHPRTRAPAHKER